MNKTKIIVVEDNIVYCEYVCNMLSREGYRNMKAYHLSTAKKHLQQATDNDIVVADLRLPDGSGIDLLCWMRKEGKMQPFIIMTDYAEVNTAVESMKLGSIDYIPKQLVEDKLAEVGYRLEDDYSYNFSVHNENSNENIFTIPLDKNLYAAQFWYLFRSRHYNHGGALGGSSENGTSANISTVLANGYGTDDVDARFEKNFYAGIVEVDGKPVMMDNGQQLEYFPLELKLNLTGSSYVKTAGARMAKYEVDRTSHSDGRQPDNDIVLFRYADALLMKSEAKVRNGEDGSLELNEVRGRVGMPYREATLENILKERLLELVWEGWRRQDMVRFGVYHKSYDQRVQLADEKNGYTTVFPIPQKSIDLNPKLKQNVGYK